MKTFANTDSQTKSKKENFVKNNVIDLFCGWIKSNTIHTQHGNKFEMNLPFLDRNNDCIRIYAIPTQDGYTLTDDGDVLGGLFVENITIGENIIERILQNYNILEKNGVLTVETSHEDMPQKMSNLIQSIVAIDSIAVTKSV